MALGIFKWLWGKNKDEAGKVSVREFTDEVETLETAMSFYIQRMAFWSIVRKIGSALAAIEWETYRRGKKVKAKEYWLWNYDPNPNQTREEFFQALAGKLYTEQEALVVEYRGSRYVADSFSTNKSIDGNTYTSVTVGDTTFAKTFKADEVLHFSISGDSIKCILTAISGMEERLLKSATKGYLRGNGIHGVLNIAEVEEAKPDFDETYADLVNNKFKKYFNSENAVLPMFEGYDFKESESGSSSQRASVSGTRDIKNLLDDVVEFTAQAIGVPASIVTGKGITAEDYKAFLENPVDPLVKMITNELNRKLYGRDLVYAGTQIAPNWSGIRHIDLFEVANPIDKLIGSGAFCINDIRRKLGLEAIDEPWADQHWMTKNYSTVEDLNVGVSGSDTPAEPGREEEDNGTE